MRRVLIFIVAAGLVFALVSGVAPATPTAWTHETNITTGMPNYPVGVATDKFGNTYVVSSQPGYEYVYRYGPYGAYLGTWGDGPGSGNGELDAPRDVDVDRWGNVFVADAGNYRVAMFNPGGLWTRSISQPGSDPEDLTNPNGVAVSNDGFVYVSDNTFDIRKFDSYGAHIGNWTTDGAAIGISCDEDGFVWVANDQATGPRPLYGNSIIKYSPAGFRWTVGAGPGPTQASSIACTMWRSTPPALSTRSSRKVRARRCLRATADMWRLSAPTASGTPTSTDRTVLTQGRIEQST